MVLLAGRTIGRLMMTVAVCLALLDRLPDVHVADPRLLNADRLQTVCWFMHVFRIYLFFPINVGGIVRRALATGCAWRRGLRVRRFLPQGRPTNNAKLAASDLERSEGDSQMHCGNDLRMVALLPDLVDVETHRARSRDDAVVLRARAGEGTQPLGPGVHQHGLDRHMEREMRESDSPRDRG